MKPAIQDEIQPALSKITFFSSIFVHMYTLTYM